MKTFTIFTVLGLLLGSNLIAQETTPKLNPSNATFVFSYKNTLSNHEFAKNALRTAKIFADPRIWSTVFSSNFRKDYQIFEQIRQGGEGKINDLVAKYPVLAPHKQTMLEINFAHKADPKAIAFVKSLKDAGYEVCTVDNVAPETIKTFQARNPELFKLIDHVITVPEDLKKLKTPNPYLYNVLKSKLFGVPARLVSADPEYQYDIAMPSSNSNKQLIWVTNRGKLQGGVQAGLPVGASYVYNNTRAYIGSMIDKLTPTKVRLDSMKRALEQQGVEFKK